MLRGKLVKSLIKWGFHPKSSQKKVKTAGKRIQPHYLYKNLIIEHYMHVSSTYIFTHLIRGSFLALYVISSSFMDKEA